MNASRLLAESTPSPSPYPERPLPELKKAGSVILPARRTDRHRPLLVHDLP